MSSLFISYRRSDSPDSVARIHGKLVARLRNREIQVQTERKDLNEQDKHPHSSNFCISPFAATDKKPCIPINH